MNVSFLIYHYSQASSDCYRSLLCIGIPTTKTEGPVALAFVHVAVSQIQVSCQIHHLCAHVTEIPLTIDSRHNKKPLSIPNFKKNRSYTYVMFNREE